MTDEEIEVIARKRLALNLDVPATTHFGKDGLAMHLAGVRGEVAFADRYGISYDQIRAVRGSDGGYDFIVHFDGEPLTFDIKTRDASGYDLLVPKEKLSFRRCANIFVLTRCVEKRVVFLGWEHPKIVKCMPPRQLAVLTHVRPFKQTRPMWQLDSLMRQRDRLSGAA